MANANVNFEVLSIRPADVKKNHVVLEVRFNGHDKIYRYVRGYNPDKAINNVQVDGCKVVFNADLEVVRIDFVHETKGSKKLAAQNGKGKNSITEEIKETIQAEEIPVPVPVAPVAPGFLYNPDGEVRHEEFETILACVESNIPVYLAGPAGSGKNHTLEQVAEALDLDFYFTNSVQQEYKLTGFVDAGGIYHETEFYKAFTKGGLFFLDEMDASIPEVLVLLNAAIANRYFEFPNGRVNAHKNFRVVAAGNTVGSGADENYTGRMVLDQATLDRFTIIDFGYSKEIEMHLAKGNAELVVFIENIRKAAEENQIRATFSYRCISMVTKLEGKLDLDKIMAIAVVKGLSKDVVNVLANNIEYSSVNVNKYTQALKNLAA